MKAILSIGSNLGDKGGYLQFALDKITNLPNTQIIKASSIYETAPQVNLDQPTFFNVVLEIETGFEARELLFQFRAIEALANRERSIKNGPRTLDIDIISYEDLSIQEENLTLPHPRAHKRQFVLIPWMEIDPEAQLGEHGLIANLSNGLDDQGVVKVSELRL
ncbi:MAG: 2-amino-4-hydroxy-6-hydroxymethyldihydropteridine diphosphokinase [Actinobacteria bacterium]|nr:2-amino-4-hydroxy-6-hydroxymethyldihydropteridine diphosphokinase [Actinomycetota bacterium]